MNKKKIIGLLAAGLIAAVATTNLNIATQESGLSEVSLANVEALAQESANDHCNRLCYDAPSWYCLLETPTSYIYCLNRYPK